MQEQMTALVIALTVVVPVIVVISILWRFGLKAGVGIAGLVLVLILLDDARDLVTLFKAFDSDGELFVSLTGIAMMIGLLSYVVKSGARRRVIATSSTRSETAEGVRTQPDK
jgi:hypothetical protein